MLAREPDEIERQQRGSMHGITQWAKRNEITAYGKGKSVGDAGLIRGGDDQPAAGPANAPRLPEQRARMIEMLDDGILFDVSGLERLECRVLLLPAYFSRS